MRRVVLATAAGLAVSSAAFAAAPAAAQAADNTAATTQPAPTPYCEYKTRMNFQIGKGTTGALYARHIQFRDSSKPTSELRATIEIPISKAHSDRAEGMVKVTFGLASGYLPPSAMWAGARTPGLQFVHVRSRQLEGTSPGHPAYKRKPKPSVRWTVGGKGLMGDGFSPEGGALFILGPSESDDAGVSDPAKLFTGGDWTFETSKSFGTPWAEYTIPADFLSGIITDLTQVMESIEKSAANGECKIGSSFGEMPMQDIMYF